MHNYQDFSLPTSYSLEASDILAEINEALRTFYPVQSECLVGFSDDVGAGFIAGYITQSTPPPHITVDWSAELPAPYDIGGNSTASKVVRVDQNRFFFYLGRNNMGNFLRILEVAKPDCPSIRLPLSALKQFHEMVAHFVEISKDRIEGMKSANVRTTTILIIIIIIANIIIVIAIIFNH
ncbi:Transcription factor Pur-alpha 1 [Bienertia sinuspersici]